MLIPSQAWGIAVGNRVAATDTLNVRSCAGTGSSCPVVATVSSGARGTVQSGPTSANGFVWWRVAWDSGPNGWSAQDFMAVVPGNLTVSGNAYCNTSPPPGPAVMLNWTASSGATSYNVYRNGSLYFQGATGTTFDNNENVTAGQSYSYFIRAINANGTTNSNTVSVSVPSSVCGSPPGNFTLSGNPYCNTSPPAGPAVLLNWTTSQGASSYKVFRNGSQIGNTTNLTTFDNNLGVVAGQTYSYSVQASNSVGTRNSNTLTVTVPSNVCSTVTCFALSRTHTGSGSNPQVSPANSAGCSAGQYVAGAQLQLTASPDSGWSVGSWSGTSNNSSTSAANQAVMPAGNHTVGVAYVQSPSGPDLEVLEILLFQPRFPDGTPRGISTSGAGTTVDGNPVTIRARIKNFGGAGNIAIRWSVDNQLIPGGSETFSFAANQERTLEKTWDTAGVAWDSDGDAHTPARVLKVEAVGHEAESVQLLVRPRPLILVHGLWSKAETWAEYGPIGLGGPAGFVGEVHPLWQSYAVGDDFVPGLRLHTGFTSCGSSPCTVWSYEDNAEVLHQYVRGVREATNAWMVDILGHSMGGLISREYLNNYFPSLPRLPGKLPVQNLLTLGTPHLGTPCSAYALDHGLLLSEDYVQDHFLGQSTYGVPLHTMGSATLFNCPYLSIADVTFYDPVVNLPSALFAGYAESHMTRITLHWNMTESREDFEDFALPILAGLEPERSTVLPAPSAIPETAESTQPVLLHSGQAALTEGTTVVSTVQIPAAERLAVLLMAGDSVGLRLRGPSGQLPSETGGDPFRYFEVTDPQPGSWRLEMSSLDGNAPEAKYSWYVDGSVYSSHLEIGTVEGATRFRATLKRNGQPVTGSSTTLEAIASTGSLTAITLFDDGQHADLLPNDGIYGQAASLAPGAYQCHVKSAVDGFTVGSTAVAIVQGGAIFADGFESGDLSAWSVVGPVGGNIVVFSDDFNDGILDADRWTWYGHTVYETGGQFHVNCEVTDDGGGVNSQYFRIAPTGLITFSRTARVGAGNHKFDGSLRFEAGGNHFGVSYADYDNSGNGECAVAGFALYRNGANTHYCSTQGIDVTGFIPGVWGAWFQEKLEWNPATGAAVYYINNQNVLNLNVGPLPAGTNLLRLRMSTWGWYTGHYQHSDDVRVTQQVQ